MTLKPAAGLLLVVLALAAAGCGGGSKKSTTTAANTSPATTAQNSGGGTSTAATAGKPKSCAELQSLASKVSASFQNTNKENIEANAQKLKEFADQTPDEIRPDFELLASDVQKIAGVLKGVKDANKPTVAEAQKLQKALSSIDQQKLQAALQHIQAWSAKNC